MAFANGFDAADIDAAVASIATAAAGSHRRALNRAAANLARLGIAGADIIGALRPPAERAGLRRSEIYSTINAGMKAGRADPAPGECEQEPAPVMPTDADIARGELANVARNVAVSGADRLDAWQDECLRIGEYVRAGELAAADATDSLHDVAINNGLDETLRREGVEHVIREALAGRRALDDRAPQQSETPASRSGVPSAELVMECAANIEAQPIEWLH